MASKPILYVAYLLRLWRSEPGSAWRASLEDPQTGERLGFSDLDAAIHFLQQKTQDPDSAAMTAPAAEPGGNGRSEAT